MVMASGIVSVKTERGVIVGFVPVAWAVDMECRPYGACCSDTANWKPFGAEYKMPADRDGRARFREVKCVICGTKQFAHELY